MFPNVDQVVSILHLLSAERAAFVTRPAFEQLYLLLMARGWESKSIEDQQAQAASKSAPRSSRLTPEQASRVRKIEGLRLSRQRITQQMEAAHNERHREMLRQSLAALDEELRSLESN